MIELYEWQRPSRDKLVRIFQSGSLIALDGSDTGVGKTFVALDTLRTLGRKAVVVCPKAVISSWRRVAQQMGCPELLLDVINSERLMKNRSPWFRDNKWLLPEGAVLIVDEVHKGCQGPDTVTTEIVARTKLHKIPVLAMSATMADSPLKLRALGYLLGLHSFNKASFYRWCFENGCRRNRWNGVEFPRTQKSAAIMQSIHEKIKDRMTRIRVDEAPGFPECDTQAILYDLDKVDTDRINELYADLETKRKTHLNPMVDILFARQHAELCKVKLLHSLVLDTLEEEHSAVVFVNFRSTIEELRTRLERQGHRVSVIWGVAGDREQQEREQAILDFQANKNRVALVTAAAGGAGLGLHDVNHERPRRAFITPSYKADEVKQVLGRIWRAGGTKAIQTFVLAADTVEEKVYASILGKLRNLDSLNDGDLDLTKGE